MTRGPSFGPAVTACRRMPSRSNHRFSNVDRLGIENIAGAPKSAWLTLSRFAASSPIFAEHTRIIVQRLGFAEQNRGEIGMRGIDQAIALTRHQSRGHE